MSDASERATGPFASDPADHSEKRDGLLGRFVALNISGSVATGAIGFVTSILLARWLGPHDRGVLATMLAVSELSLYVVGVGVPWATIYYAAREDVRALLGNSVAMTCVLAVALVPSAWIWHQQLANLFAKGEGGLTWVLAAALIPITFLSWAVYNQLQGMLLFRRFNITSVVAKLTEAASIVTLLGILGVGVAAGVGAGIIAAAMMVFGALKPILASGKPRFDRRLMGMMLRYGSRVQVGSVFEQAIARVDVLILQFFRPLSEVGYYVVAQIVAEIVLRLSLAFQSSAMSLASHYEGSDRQASTTADAVRHHGILAAVMCAANALFGTIVIAVAYGPQYRSAVIPMLILLPGIWFLGTASVIRSDLSGRGHPGLASKLAGIATVVTLAGDFALIPPLGMVGAALASVIAYVTYGIASLIALRTVSGLSVHSLIVPRREDLAAYMRALRGLVRWSRRRLRPG